MFAYHSDNFGIIIQNDSHIIEWKGCAFPKPRSLAHVLFTIGKHVAIPFNIPPIFQWFPAKPP